MSQEKNPAESASPNRRTRLRRRKRVAEILGKVLESSVADETELVWFERQHGTAHLSQDATGNPATPTAEIEGPRVTVLIRVAAGGRLGWHRTDVTDPALLANAVRHALGLATSQARSPGRRFFPESEDPAAETEGYFDRALEKLDAPQAAQKLSEWCSDSVQGSFHFSRTHLAVWNSHGLRRHAKTTEATLDVSVGEGPGTGYASGSARSLEFLNPEEVIERARSRVVEGQVTSLPTGPVTTILAPEAVIELLDIANTFAFAGRAYLDGSSFLTQHRGVQVFDRSVHVRDDARRTPGMPFPFDLEGVLKNPIDLIVEGRASTPALNRSQGGEAGLEPTGQSVGGEDAMFGNLFLLPGHQDLGELMRQAEGGLFISRLDRPECFDPKRLGIRAVARGVRRIEGGRFGAPLPDLSWQTSLLAALARLAGIGRHPVVKAMPSTPLGGICAPALALEDATGFERLGD